MTRPAQYRRLVLIVTVALAGFGWLFVRLYEIQITRHREFLNRARRFSLTQRWVETRRGEIRDRNGKILAISVPVKEVYLDPVVCSNRLEQVTQTVSSLLRIQRAQLSTRVRACLEAAERGIGSSRKALLLRDDVSMEEWRMIRTALEFETFGFQREGLTRAEQAQLRKLRRRLLFARDRQIRLYPAGASLCQALGFVAVRTNSPGMLGVSGLERSCDQLLAGRNGFFISRQDAAGNELPGHRSCYEEPIAGNHVVLTVDLRIQRVVEQALAEAMTKSQARSASAIVMVPATGEILAVATYPGFDPQNPGKAQPASWRNTVFMDMVEPGSIMKFITLAAALEHNVTRLENGIYCEQGYGRIDRVPVQDHARYGLLTVRQAFAKSSNVAFAKLGFALGPQRLYACMTNFGLGHPTGIAYAGETGGRIAPPKTWSTMALTRAAFGQGVSVSQLQMAVAMCAIANEGRLMRPRLVSRVESAHGQVLVRFQPQFVRSVVSPETARQLREALKAVVSEGTGTLAAMEDYTVAAKTGTAQKANATGYLPGRYYSSMLGFFPANAPRVVISVALDEPRNGYYAGTVAAPAFREIAGGVAACLQIPGDKLRKTEEGLHEVTKESGVGRTFASVSKP